MHFWKTETPTNTGKALQKYSWCKKCKGSPYSIAEHSVPELILVLGSQPAGDISHKPGGRLPLLSVRPAVILATFKRAATSYAAWWTEARWVWSVCLQLLPDSVVAAIWTQGPFCTWVQHANHSATLDVFSILHFLVTFSGLHSLYLTLNLKFYDLSSSR